MNDFLGKAVKWLTYVFNVPNREYTSLIFFGCLILFLAVFFLLKRQWAKRVWILIGNLVFYFWASGFAALVIISATALIVYLISRRMETVYRGYETETKELAPKEKMTVLDAYKRRTRFYLILALILIIGVWVYVKVGRLQDLNVVTGFQQFDLLTCVIVPLGISYYSLSCIGYLLDVYWRKTKPEHNFLILFSVITYFPHIIQGPISKYQKLLKQMNAIPKFNYKRVSFGFQLMVWGYIKKIVIADRLALYTNTIFSSPGDFAGIEIILAVILCIFQLYADFSGCMDIVRGISQVMGIELEENFRQPFLAKSAAEFWRRWHITLGAWMREYIYFPISTNPRFIKWSAKIKRNGKAWIADLLKLLIPMLVVWILTGLWHGTGWDYIVWGLYWCVLIVLSIELKPLTDRINTRLGIQTDRRLFRFWQAFRSCVYFGVARMFTVAGGLVGCGILWSRLFTEARFWVLFDGSLYTHGLDQKDFYIALAGIVLIVVVDILHEKSIQIRESVAATPLPVRWAFYLCAILAIVVFGIYGSGYDPANFVYGAF